MSTLVVYASKHGATRGIAERIAVSLNAAGERAETREAGQAARADDLTRWDAFVVGSAVYLGHWQPAAVEFVRANRGILAERPVWLFSSGPLGTELTDAKGRDLTVTSVPAEIADFTRAIEPREHCVFFGALTAEGLGFAGRALRALPAGRKILPLGDYRDWDEIDAWATGIAAELSR